MKIKQGKTEYAKLYIDHSERLFNSNTKDRFIFSPREAGSYKGSSQDVESVKKRWNKKPSRTWV